ncbi:ClC family H(+)/Cl(-) exchange transporter, partial [Vibrio cholerae]|nr:ClC family H(+)/Cl(-) exchange transporter [Vibrio cholerae]
MSTRETFKISLLAKMPKDVINQFLSKDKTPFSVLFLSLLVGILAGLVGTYFE